MENLFYNQFVRRHSDHAYVDWFIGAGENRGSRSQVLTAIRSLKQEGKIEVHDDMPNTYIKLTLAGAQDVADGHHKPIHTIVNRTPKRVCGQRRARQRAS